MRHFGMVFVAAVTLFCASCAGVRWEQRGGDAVRVYRIPPERPGEARIRAALIQRVSVDFRNTKFSDALNDLGRQVGMPVYEMTSDDMIDTLPRLNQPAFVVDVKARDEEGITPETRLRLTLKDVSLDTVLRFILSQVNLDFAVEEDVVLITNADGMSHASDLRFYDVRGLLRVIRECAVRESCRCAEKKATDNRPASTSRCASASQPASTSQSAFRPAYPLAIDPYSGLPTSGWELPNGATYEETKCSCDPLAELVYSIQGTCCPWAWMGTGSIETFRGDYLLIVTTPQVHGDIEQFLCYLADLLRMSPEVMEEIEAADGRDWWTRTPAEREQVRALRRRLARQVSVDLKQVPFMTAIERLREIGDINIVVDGKALTAESVTDERLVSYQASDAPLSQVLRAVCEQVNLDYEIIRGVVLVANFGMDKSSEIRTV